MGTRIKGFNILLKMNGKKLAGTTANSFGIKPKTKESYIKDDDGKSQTEVIGFDAEGTINGLMILNDGGDASIYEDYDTLCAATMSGELIPFVYGNKTANGKTYTGTLMITDYKEDTDSENNGTYSVSYKVSPSELIPATSNSTPQVKTVTLTGISGTAVITGPGQLVKALAFTTDLATTAAQFVSVCAAAYLAKNIVVTSSGAVITFTASSVSVLFETPVITTVTSNLNGTVA